MRYLYCENQTETKALVLINHSGDGLSDVEKQTWIKVDDTPTFPEPLFGKVTELYINPKTLEMWFEFKDRTLTSEEETLLLKQKVMLMQNALDELILGGM